MAAECPAPVASTTTQQKQPDSFAWNSCSHYDDQKRIKIKEEALEFGILQCEKIIKYLESSSPNKPCTSDASASTPQGWEDIERWIQKCKALITIHKKFEVLVGVAGPTGSGKTSALNALLGLRGLLATNSQEAATAVPCKVAYNDDDRPTMRFRACVAFRTMENFVKQLDQFFEDLKLRNELQATDTDSLDDEEAIRTIDANLRPTFEIIRTVFGVEEQDVVNMTTQTLIHSNPGVFELLGTTKRFHGGDLDHIAEQIKPYMDSTTTDHEASGLEFAAWPLIDEVEIFVKSEILRNGVVLVDLPGLCDWVESRAAVAKAYFPKLAATLIVTPARRAADDSTSVKLMSEHQELRMKMDGKFHRRSYCVAISQIDEIDRDSALRSRKAKTDIKLQRLINEEKTLRQMKKDQEGKLKIAKKKIKKLEATVAKKTRSGVTKKKFGDKQRLAKKLGGDIKALTAELHSTENDLKKHTDHIIFQCVKNRNQFLEGRIQHDFQRRQASITSSVGGNSELYDGTVSVCPFSSKAFWGCVPDEEDEFVDGFPEERCSGIPNLRQWIRSATIEERESHADSILHDLHNLLNTIQIWTMDEWSCSQLNIDKEWAEQEIIPPFYDTVKKDLEIYWKELNRSVLECNPFSTIGGSLSNCVAECRDVVQNWAFLNPVTATKVHWTTYQANIVRYGGNFTSRSKGGSIDYHWMQDISDVLLRTIVADWNRAFSHEIPQLEQPACNTIDRIWDGFLQQLLIDVGQAIPELLPNMGSIIPDLRVVKEQIKAKLRQALKNITQGASKVHPNIVDSITEKWRSTFQEARLITGNGSFKMRQQLLVDFARRSGRKMLDAAFNDTSHRIGETFAQFLETLKEISEFAIQEVQDHFKLFLNKAIFPDHKIEEPLKENIELQQNVLGALREWAFKWKGKEAISDLHMKDEAFSIPDEYCPIKDESDDDDEEDGDVMDIDDEESESEDSDRYPFY